MFAKRRFFCYTMFIMIKKIDIAGIELDNYTVRETIMQVEKQMSDQGFHTIEEVNMDMLILGETDEVVRQALTTVEHTVIAEAGILDAVGAGSYQRKHEIEHHDFFYEMMKRIERNHKTVFLIGDTEENTIKAQEELAELYPKCVINGTEALENCQGAVDAVVNEINANTPDVILSVLPSPTQEHFLVENREKLSAGLWYGIGDRKHLKPMNRLAGGLRNLIRTRRLEKSLNSYERERGKNS